MSSDRVEAAVRVLGARGLSLDGVHVAVRGWAPVERHWSPDIRRDVFSASKTITSLAIGIAEGEGALALDDAVIDYLPPSTYDAAPGVERITVAHLLQMTSGVVYRWEDPDADRPNDPVRDILSATLGRPPGTSFAYRGANTYLLSRVLHASTGSDLRDYLLARLFAPLGINNPHWLRCPRGYSLGAVGLQLRTSELARIGELLLDEGRWLDEQLVPAGYLHAMIADAVPTGSHVATGAIAPHPENARYGRHVWLCARDGAWRMDGIYGQFSIVLPNHHACITVTAQYEGPTTDILDAVWSELVPALS